MNQKLNMTYTSWWLHKIRSWKVDSHRFRCRLDSDKLLFLVKFIQYKNSKRYVPCLTHTTRIYIIA